MAQRRSSGIGLKIRSSPTCDGRGLSVALAHMSLLVSDPIHGNGCLNSETFFQSGYVKLAVLSFLMMLYI